MSEGAVLNALVKRGWDVLVPFGSGQPYDLVIHVDDSVFVRVQCKTAWESRGCLIFNSLSTDHGHGAQSYVGLADIFGVYLPTRDQVYLVPLDGVAATEGRLRLEAARNNQRKRIRLASEYEFENWTAAALTELVLNGTSHPYACAA